MKGDGGGELCSIYIDKDYCDRYCIKRLLLFAMHCAF